MQVIVTISLQYGVLDPQGRAIGRSLTALGFREVGDVRVGKRITLEIDETDASRAGSLQIPNSEHNYSLLAFHSKKNSRLKGPVTLTSLP